MDIFKYALRMEKDGELYYRELSQQAEAQGLKTIFTMLADAEVKHYKMIEHLQKGDTNSGLSGDPVLGRAKNIFTSMKEQKNSFQFTISQKEMYEKALDVEEKSNAFYLLKAEEMQSEPQRQIFLQLAKEEKKHMILMQNIIDFISRPQQWLEDAEWYHLDEY